ncbi:MAG: hypothetical protein R2773_05080 [Flavobacteriaceae bacterium]
MSFSITYKPLCSVNFYHRYFLDDGLTAFDATNALKNEQLQKYDFREFMKLIPSEETLGKLNGHKVAFKVHPSGFHLYVSSTETAPNTYAPLIPLAQDLKLTFLMYIKDGIFENYSTVGANPTIPYFFSNKKPFTEGGSFRYIDLETTTHDLEDFEIVADTYTELQKKLTGAELIGLFGILQLEMAGDDTTGIDGNTRNVLHTDGTLQSNPNTYKIQFKNRNTIWNYIDPTDQSLIHSSDPTELPLVKNGIVGYSFNSAERPSAQPDRLVFEKDGGGNIIKTISEIFIN